MKSKSAKSQADSSQLISDTLNGEHVSVNAIKRNYYRLLYSLTGGLKAEDIYKSTEDRILGKTVVLVNKDCVTGKTDPKFSLFGGRVVSRNTKYDNSFYYIEWQYNNEEIVDTINNIYGNDKFTLDLHEVSENVSSHNINDLRIISLTQTCIKTIDENGLLYFFAITGFIVWALYCVAAGSLKDINWLFKKLGY